MPPKTLSRTLRILPRYSLVSLLCLAVDSALYAVLIMAGAPISISAALGYLFGLIVSYMILTRIGINEERNKQLQKRTIFAATGLFGVFITYSSALITSTYLSANPIVVKLFSVALSFIAVYILRAKYVFY